jgi:hypothetical protein
LRAPHEKSADIGAFFLSRFTSAEVIATGFADHFNAAQDALGLQLGC